VPTDDLSDARQRIQHAYDPQLFHQSGRRLIDLLTEKLTHAQSEQGSVIPWQHPEALVAAASKILAECEGDSPIFAETKIGTVPMSNAASADRFAALVAEMLRHGINIHDPRYVGHQVPAPVPIGGLFDAVGSVTNQCMAVYEMGPWATAAEHAVVQQLGRLIGWQPGTFAGAATHGGSAANLTGLLTARNVALPGCWQQGIPRDGRPPVLLIHADAHYSVARSAGILGLGTDCVIRIGLDDRRRMDPAKLEAAIQKHHADGQKIVAVAACACSTPIGAFDPLQDVAEVCRRHEVWLHVDAAHGGAALFSERHRQLLAGLDRADSVVWDAHKMLFMPALCALVFYRDRDRRFDAFHQNAPYLFDPSAPGLAEYDSGLRALECTKRAATFALWGVWAMFGPKLFADLVDVTFELGKTFYEKLSAADDFVALHEPQCNIVVFRYVPRQLADAPPERLGQFQMEVRRKIVESGEFYLVSTKLDGVGALRVTLINPLTTPDHLDRLLNTIRLQGQRLLES
jgi:L-2,4-diaminobutyrate decarboxylase